MVLWAYYAGNTAANKMCALSGYQVYDFVVYFNVQKPFFAIVLYIVLEAGVQVIGTFHNS